MPRTMFEKIWDAHVVHAEPGKQTLLYIDLHLVHEVTSPQAFEGLRLAGRKVRRPELTVATPDHNVPTTDRTLPIADPISKQQIDTLRNNCREFGIRIYDLNSPQQGIVHVIGPELGITQPGMTIVCGDSHTATHGAFGALAFGIGTSEVEHVLATQTLLQSKAQNVRTARRRPTRPRRDGQGCDSVSHRPDRHRRRHRLRDRIHRQRDARLLDGRADDRVQHVDRSRARAGMIAPDEKTFEYMHGREFAPKGKDFDAAVERWRQLPSDAGAKYDRVEVYNAADIAPQVTWGTNPGQVVPVVEQVPDPAKFETDDERKAAAQSLEYMGLEAGKPMQSLALDRVFIGSCTNSRIEDLRAAAAVVRGYHVANSVHAMVVPGSGQVKKQAESEGFDRVFKEAGFDWREAGCSMCLGMNPDILDPRPALREHQQPQFRRPPRQRRPHAPGQPRHGRRRRGGRAFCRYPRVGVSRWPMSPDLHNRVLTI